jgi:hypothetical protein
MTTAANRINLAHSKRPRSVFPQPPAAPLSPSVADRSDSSWCPLLATWGLSCLLAPLCGDLLWAYAAGLPPYDDVVGYAFLGVALLAFGIALMGVGDASRR